MQQFRIEFEKTFESGSLLGAVHFSSFYFYVPDVLRLVGLPKGSLVGFNLWRPPNTWLPMYEYDSLLDDLTAWYPRNPRVRRLVHFLQYGHVRNKQQATGGQVVEALKECGEDEGRMLVSWLLEKRDGW